MSPAASRTAAPVAFEQAARPALADARTARGGRQRDDHDPRPAPRPSSTRRSAGTRFAQAGEAIRTDALLRLDELLVALERAVVAAGGEVHWARDAVEANEVVDGSRPARRARRRSSRSSPSRPTRSSSTTRWRRRGSRRSRPTSPSGSCSSPASVRPISSSRRSTATGTRSPRSSAARWISPAFPTTPRRSTAAARVYLREAFLRARVAISGANFAVAETGAVCVVESEGNGRMCTTLPETLMTVMGIEKVVAEWRDLGVLLQLLPRSATGERMNPYTSIWTGVQAEDGPTSFHLVLLDAGRTRALADPEGRPALRCIRCSACVNVCPVYRQTGGHAYPTVYAGPIGAILQPQLTGERGAAASLPYASTLCGAWPTSARWGSTSRGSSSTSGGRSCARGRPGLEGRGAPRPRARFSSASATSARSGSPACSRAPRPRRPGPLDARPARRLGALPQRCPASPTRRSASGGRRVSATREAVLGRIRAALAAPLPRRAARLPRARVADAGGRGRRGFVERVEETGATVCGPATRGRRCPRRSRARVPRGSSSRPTCPGLRPAGVEVVEDDGLSSVALDGMDGAVTTCAAACADTGTIAFDGAEGQGRRAITLVPDLHVCVVRAEQVVETVPELVERLAPSARGGRPIVLVSGPSATSDIELVRVEGVHGPRRLVVVLVEETRRDGP